MALSSDGTYYYAVKINEVPSDYWRKPFGRQLDDLKKINRFRERATRNYICAKGKPTHHIVRSWLKEHKPKAYYAKWQKETSYYKDDSIEIFYERN